MAVVRYRLTNAERSDLVADQVALALDRAPIPRRDAMQLLAERVLQIRDDLHRRTRGKQPTFALTRKIKDSAGVIITEVELSTDARLKMVGGVIGAMLTGTHRNTRTWVLDAIDEALAYLPWKVRS